MLFGADSAEGNFFEINCDTAMDALIDAIEANAKIDGQLVSLNILDNAYRKCNSIGKPSIYWSPGMFDAHEAGCVSCPCPAVRLHLAVQEMKKHPTMQSLFGIDSTLKSLKVQVGCSVSTPLMWAFFAEISRHQRLDHLDLSAFQCKEVELKQVCEWFVCNSLLRVVKISPHSMDHEMAFRIGIELSLERRVGSAVFVRGCSFLGSAAIRTVLECVYGVGLQSSKFLKYKSYAGGKGGGTGRLKVV